jgi:hypothetical protein
MLLFRLSFLFIGLTGLFNHAAEQNVALMQENTPKQSDQKMSDDEGKFIIMHCIADTLRTECNYELAKQAYLALLENPHISTYKLRNNGLAYARLMTALGLVCYQEDKNSEKSREYLQEAASYGCPAALFWCALEETDSDHAIKLLEKSLACTDERYKLTPAEHNAAVKMLIELYEKVDNNDGAQRLRNQFKQS